MAGILGLGSSGSNGLNSDLIAKLKEAENEAIISPLEKKLQNITKERETVNNIQTKVNELLDAIKMLSLNQTTSTNVFQQKTATSSGDGVVFDSDDIKNIKDGSLHVKVEQLAKKDVWQTNQFDSKDNKVNQGIFKINGTEVDTTDKTYDEVVQEINKISGIDASIVDNSDGKFRISIKSTETGKDNTISFEGSSEESLMHFGLTDNTNHVQTAQDMKMKLDGVEYSGSSNTIIVNGLTIRATKEDGEAFLEIQPDTSSIKEQLDKLVTAYNAFIDVIDTELNDTNSTLDNRTAIRTIKEQLKNELFGTGNTSVTNEDAEETGAKTIFNYGFSFNSKSGYLTLDSTEYEKALKEDSKSLENLFIGVPEKKGIGTRIDELISNDGINKAILDYETSMASRETKITEEKTKEEKALNNKYEQMAQRFAAYTTMITQMENSFSGLQLLIQQSTSK